MKKLYYSAAILFISLTSCSSSDDSSGAESSFLPLTATSSWFYDVSLNTENTGEDHIFVSGESVIDGKTFQKISADGTPSGFYTNILNNNNIRKDGDKLRITGTTGLAVSQDLPVNINVSDFVIFKENSSNNKDLDAITGLIEQDLQGLPLKIDYKLTSVFKESLDNFTVPGKLNYTNVKVIKLIANLKVTTVYILPVINTPLTIALLDPQDVIVSTQYYAEGVGMVYSKTEINYQLNDFSQFEVELPIPPQGSSTIEEFLK